MAERLRNRKSAEPGRVLVSSAQALHGRQQEQYAITYDNWQEELWAYRKSIGEYSSVMNWYAAGFGRIHLRAGVWKPGLKEPELLEKGVAAQLVQDLVVNAKGGETQFMRSWGLHLAVPGVGYFIGRERPDGSKVYDVKSADVVKTSARKFENKSDPRGEKLGTYDIQVAPNRWETLDPNLSLVGRVFDPDPQFDYMATSMTQACLTTLREIDLYNRAIVATLLSRIAFNGILFIPEEVTFPVNEQFKDAPDPFIAELLNFAAQGIKNPGSPSAAIPFPIRVKSDWIEKFKHLLLASGLDPKIIEARQAAVTRLAEQLPAPPEAMTGVGDMNHWSAWQASEDNVKRYFGPIAEILCGGLNEVFLWPMLQAAGKSLTDDAGNPIVMWYDASDLTDKPDNSQNAENAHDGGWIKNDAYFKALGFDPADAPSPDELRTQILTTLAMSGTQLPDAYFLLYPKDKPEPVTQPPVLVPQTPGGAAPDAVGPSSSATAPPGTPPPNQPVPAAPTA